MKYEGITLEFVNFIKARKIADIEGLLKGKDKKLGILKEIIGLLPQDISGEKKETILLLIGNEFNHIDLDSAVNHIRQEFILNGRFVFDDAVNASDWLEKLDEERRDWGKYQNEPDYKVQLLKTKISTFIKKLFNKKSFWETHQGRIKDIVNRSTESAKLEFDIEGKVEKIKESLTKKQVNILSGIDRLKDGWIVDVKKISEKYDYGNWLDWASENAKNISFATHAIKLTHSKISGASNIYDGSSINNSGYVVTGVMNNKPIDMGISNNALAPIGSFLKLGYQEHKIADQLKNGDISAIQCFAQDEQQIKNWTEGFIKSFEDSKPSSHILAKQVYYPVNSGYHLLSPLVSSSLTHALYENITSTFKKEAKEIRDASRNGKYHEMITISYMDIAVLKVTASNHSNASPLNGKRGGRTYLLPCTPPTWQSNLKPPINSTSLFIGEFDHRAWKLAKELQSYLGKIQHIDSNKKIRDEVKRLVYQIIDTLFDYAAEVQNLREQAGWSEGALKLKQSQKLWLDPYRADDSFQAARKVGDWQVDICRDFGLWLNKKLENKKMFFGKYESDNWAKVLKSRLREFEGDLEELA